MTLRRSTTTSNELPTKLAESEKYLEAAWTKVASLKSQEAHVDTKKVISDNL